MGAIARTANDGTLTVERAQAMLAACVAVDEAKELRDQAKAMAVYERTRKAGKESEVYITEIVARAERRMGQLLKEAPKQNGARGAGKKVELLFETPLPLSDLGVSKKESHQFQKLAAIPAKEFERQVEGLKCGGKRPTTAAILRSTEPAKEKPRAPVKTAPAAAASEPKAVEVPDSDEPEPWLEDEALADVCIYVGELTDRWPVGRKRIRLVFKLRELANKIEKWDANEFGGNDGLHA